MNASVMPKHATRRTFLKTAALAAAPTIIPASALGLASSGRPAPSERIAIGFVGTGDHGISMNVRSFLGQPDAQVVALCDVDQSNLNRAIETATQAYASRQSNSFKGFFTTKDFRELVSRDGIDAVQVSTPDHWHVLVSLAAVRAGKDVICEKPLTMTVHEGRVLSDTVKRFGRIFQVSSENRSKSNFLRAAELCRNGRLGKLQTIRVELPADHAVRGGVGYGNRVSRGTAEYDRITSPAPVPEGLDYDMWLGPAPDAPYCPGRCHWNFRWCMDYSGGHLTDWGAHILDIAQWANGTETTGPISVEPRFYRWPGEGMLYDAATEWDIWYDYANGTRLQCRSGSPSIKFEGTEAWIFCEWMTFTASSPALLNDPISASEIRLRTNRFGEHRDFLDCVKSRQATYAPAEVGHRTISIAHIGNIAMKLGRKLKWDPAAERFPKDDAANRMLSRAMRGPWHL